MGEGLPECNNGDERNNPIIRRDPIYRLGYLQWFSIDKSGRLIDKPGLYED